MKRERGGDTRGRSDEQMSAEEGSDRDNGGEGGNKQTREDYEPRNDAVASHQQW